MKLSTRIILTVVTLYFLMVVVISVTTNLLLLNRIDTLESEGMKREISQVEGLISYEVEGIRDICIDWAWWDDTYIFMQDQNEEYLDSNLVDSTYDGLRLNAIVYLDSAGQPVYAYGYDLDEQVEIPLPGALLDTFGEQDLVFTDGETGDPVQGLIMVDGQLIMVAACPILTSNEEGPSRGTLIFGRLLNDAVLAYLSELADVPVAVYRYDDEPATPFLVEARDALADAETVYVAEIDEDTFAGAVALQDIGGTPVALLQSLFDRDWLQPIRRFGLSLMIGLLLLGTATSVVAYILVDQWLLRRLSLFSRDIEAISVRGDLNRRVQVIGNDELTGVIQGVNSMLDVLKETRDALESSVEQYRDLFDNAHDMIQSVDAEGMFVYTNPAWRETLGYAREEIASLRLMDIIHPDSREKCMELFQRVIRGETVDSIETSFVTKDGRKIAVVGSANCRFIDEKPVYTRGVFHDISEVKEARVLLRQMYETERTLRQELQDEITKRIEFSRVVAHELKNSLTALMASSELLAEYATEGNARRLATNIMSSAEHLNSRIREMLDMARMEMDALEIHLAPLNLDRLLREVAEGIRPLAAKREQTLTVDVPEGLPLVAGDADRLSQVIINLLDNASRYTPSGGSIKLTAEVREGFLKVIVTDTGKGIEEKEMQFLFTPYYRAERDRDRISGLGLGLALCKRLIELHGGDIGVDSEVGKGTTFYFTVPLFRDDIQDSDDIA